MLCKYASLYTEMTSAGALFGVGAADDGFCAFSAEKPIKKRKTYLNMGGTGGKLKKRSWCLTRAAQKGPKKLFLVVSFMTER